jgi:hypothetical protein
MERNNGAEVRDAGESFQLGTEVLVFLHQINSDAARAHSGFVDLRARNGVVFDHASELSNAIKSPFITGRTLVVKNHIADMVALRRDCEFESFTAGEVTNVDELPFE